MEGARNRLLRPPPHGILRVGRRRKKTKEKTKQKPKVHSCPCPVLTVPRSSATHSPRPFSHSSRKPWFLQSRATAAVTPSSLGLIQVSFLPPGQGIALHRFLLPRLALFYSPDLELEETPSVLLSPGLTLPYKHCIMLCFLNDKGHSDFWEQICLGDHVSPGGMTLPCLISRCYSPCWRPAT